MSKVKERAKRLRKAFEKGEEARLAGVPLKANPYVISAWKVGEEWERGWHAQDFKLKGKREEAL